LKDKTKDSTEKTSEASLKTKTAFKDKDKDKDKAKQQHTRKTLQLSKTASVIVTMTLCHEDKTTDISHQSISHRHR
jgi:hypothetical protein